MKINCIICGKEFQKRKSSQVCCSKRCYAKNWHNNNYKRKELKPKKCPCCNEQFTPKNTSCQKYCNIKCRNKHSNRGRSIKVQPIKTCVFCGKKFRPKHKHTQKYCNPQCRQAHTNQKRYNAIHRQTTIFQQLVNAHWDKQCMIQGCRYNKTIDIHRIIPGNEGGLYEIDNVSALCPNHHAEIHRLRKKVHKIKKFVFVLV